LAAELRQPHVRPAEAHRGPCEHQFPHEGAWAPRIIRHVLRERAIALPFVVMIRIWIGGAPAPKRLR
jgi:hypothetical protein